MAMLGRGGSILSALVVAAAALVAAPGAGSAEKVGVNSAVNPDAQGTPPGGQARANVGAGRQDGARFGFHARTIRDALEFCPHEEAAGFGIHKFLVADDVDARA